MGGSLRTLVQDKKNAANDAIDAWQRFLQFHSALKTWCDEKEAFLAEPFSFTNLSAAKLKLQDYNSAMKSSKNASKNITEMEKELKKIDAVGSSGDLAEKLSDVERQKSEIESILMEKNATLQEMTEEWDQCEKKLKESKSWISKANDSLDSLQNKKRPIRDQLNMRDKMLSDITIQRKRAVMALEKLKVHFREEITTEQDIQKLGREITEELDTLTENIKEQCKTLESCLTQLDQYQQEIGVLRQQILACEGELRSVSSPAYTAKDRDKALAEQSVSLDNLQSSANEMEETLKGLSSSDLDSQSALIQFTMKSVEDLEIEADKIEKRILDFNHEDIDFKTLSADLTTCKTKLVTLHTIAETQNSKIERFKAERKKKVIEIKRYQAMLIDLEEWLGEAQATIRTDIRLTTVKIVRDQIRASEVRKILGF